MSIHNLSFVTGLWQDSDKNQFESLLENLKDHDLIVYADEDGAEFVRLNRDLTNTTIIKKEKSDFSYPFFPFDEKIASILGKKDENKCLRLSKMFMLHDSINNSPFQNSYSFWVEYEDNSESLFTENLLRNIKRKSSRMLFLENEQEVLECFFGGHNNAIRKGNAEYYHTLESQINENKVPEPSEIFALMIEKDSSMYKPEKTESLASWTSELKKIKPKNTKDVDLYIITYNSPMQLQMVLDSFEKYDTDFLTETNLILINNSIKEFSEYRDICKKYDIVEHKFDNIGICGGRQWAAEHFSESDADYMMFFEDDMLLDHQGKCNTGFTKNIPNTFENCMNITTKENYDFFKMCFTEFYGDNTEQWSWHNLASDKRDAIFPNTKKRPYTKYKNIKTYDGIPYAEGEVYYCNWPHIINKEGNQKCFLDTKWEHPYEQTWMSHIYQMTIAGKVKPGILLASPFTHNRVEHYTKEERREN